MKNKEINETKGSRKRLKHYFYPFFMGLKEGIYKSEQAILTIAPFLKPKLKTPIIKENTFIVWEPCTKSHAEVVPGYVKYFADLGYHVSVIVDKGRLKEGLFSKYNLENISLNKLSRDEVRRYFEESDLSNIKGVLITTIGKLCDCINYEQVYDHFNPNIDKSKLFFVEHEASFSIDNNSWDEKNITLRKLNYKGAKSVVVNPHFFGEIQVTDKNEITNFITVGSLKPRKKNCDTIIDAVKQLHDKGVKNFKVTVVGKGDLKGIPKEIRKYFDIKGRLSFKNMYEEIEKSDFMLTSYDDTNFEHTRYITSGTSGNFQLIFGFTKPCLIIDSFAEINGFNEENSILYKKPENYAEAMEKGIKLSKEDYKKMQDALKCTVKEIYQDSLNNIKEAILARK